MINITELCLYIHWIKYIIWSNADMHLEFKYLANWWLVSWPSPLYAREKGSGNIVYNELSQTQECGATNQIAPFVMKMLFCYLRITNAKFLTTVLLGAKRWRFTLEVWNDKAIVWLMVSAKRTLLDRKSFQVQSGDCSNAEDLLCESAWQTTKLSYKWWRV